MSLLDETEIKREKTFRCTEKGLLGPAYKFFFGALLIVIYLICKMLFKLAGGREQRKKLSNLRP